MIIKFVKNHISGLAKGTVHEVTTDLGKRMIDTKFAKEGTQEELNNYKKGVKAGLEERAAELQKEGLRQQSEQKEIILKARKIQLEPFEGFFDAKLVTLDMSQSYFNEVLKEADQAKNDKETVDKVESEKVELDKQEHFDLIHSQSIDDLKKYIEETELKVELGKNPTQPDMATLILIAEEDKGKKKDGE